MRTGSGFYPVYRLVKTENTIANLGMTPAVALERAAGRTMRLAGLRLRPVDRLFTAAYGAGDFFIRKYRTVAERHGDFFIRKYRTVAERHGTQHAAYLLRKQGVPVEVAAVILAARLEAA